ncbi:acyltransferase family protein [Acinetobacter sp. 194]|uniref:lysophospholipid acyltransferase family protein n=1 Tax=Acinetobacter shaoyimingii TaxID=2715164 RepID=UPI00140E011F|nr:lysophospholipid acyltransferase family protein [Acinetobacter shaoyimingii]NHB58490.1 acyltransferase family protein [Acinetobacter shaoyimingii]
MHIQHNSKLIRLGSLLQRFYFRPTFFGVEHINPNQPAMYVGNHTIYGVLDSPIIIDYLYTEHKIAIVSLADHLHFKVPLWRKVVTGMGGVDGIQEYARQAMQQGYSLLIFPGGGREVAKRRGEEYQLIWKERYGFLKLAQEFNYDIVPFAALGGDDVYELGFDANTLLEQKWFKKLLTVPSIGKLLRNGEVIPSVPKNIIPKRVHFYFKFLPNQKVDKELTAMELKKYRDDLQEKIYQTLQVLVEIRTLNTKL